MRKSVKVICDELITVKNFELVSTKEFVEKVYGMLGWPLIKVDGEDLIHGTREIPKLMSVIRRVQLRKKAIREHLVAVEKRRKANET